MTTGSVVQVEYISGRPDALWFLLSSFQNRSFQTQKTAAHTQFLTQRFFLCHLNKEARGAKPRHHLEAGYHRQRSSHQPSNPRLLGSSITQILLLNHSSSFTGAKNFSSTTPFCSGLLLLTSPCGGSFPLVFVEAQEEDATEEQVEAVVDGKVDALPAAVEVEEGPEEEQGAVGGKNTSPPKKTGYGVP